MSDETLWNDDLIKQLRMDLLDECPGYKIKKGRILKDIFLQTDLSGKMKLQFGLFEQDIVIYKDTISIESFQKSNVVKIHNIDRDLKDEICIPKIIIELKYNGVTTHGLITYSNISQDIKSIFPHCKYLFLMRYKKNSSDNKLLRNGKGFDNILYLSSQSAKKKYTAGDFEKELQGDAETKENYDQLIRYLKYNLKKEKKAFLK